MKGFAPLFLGIIGTFVFSWAGLAWIPNLQIGHLDPQTDDEGADRYPWPRSGMAERGRQVYAANGCVYCHTQQVRPDYDSSDIDRKWGDRRSAPRDYLFDRPTFLGKMRMGPDLANVGHRAPSEDANTPATSPPAGAGGASAAPGGSPPPPAAAGANAPAPGGSPPAPSPATGAASPPAGGSSPAQNAASNSPAPGASTTSPPAGAGTASPAPAGSAVAGQNPPPNAPAAGAGNSPNPAASPGTSTEATAGPNGEPLPYTAAWHHKHLYSPRSIALDSIMPAYRFLYDKRRVEGQIATDALKLTGDDAPPQGYEIVPTYDAKCLVAYLMSLDQSHPLKEVKSAGPAAPAKGGK